MRALPEEDAAKPAHGRRLLAFSDSRQRAAHFAPYLARTTAEKQYMRPLLDGLQEAAQTTGGEGASLDDVADRFLKSVQKQPFECLITLLQHFTAPLRAAQYTAEAGFRCG